MNQHVRETNEQARVRLKLAAEKFGLNTADVDFLSSEDVAEALRQIDAGLLPVRLTRHL